MNNPENLETVIIDIPNKKFEINGKPFGEGNEFHLSFEDGTWYMSVYLPHRHRGIWSKYNTDGSHQNTDNNKEVVNK